jgi:hypothetical protein
LLKGPPGGPPKAGASVEEKRTKPRARAGRRREKVRFIKLDDLYLWDSGGVKRIMGIFKSPGG